MCISIQILVLHNQCSHYIMHKLSCLISNKTDMQKMSSKYFKQQNPKKLRIYSSQGNFIWEVKTKLILLEEGT